MTRAAAPVVTGISPIEGVPGTKVTIRGENLGSRPEDLVGKVIYFFSLRSFRPHCQFAHVST